MTCVGREGLVFVSDHFSGFLLDKFMSQTTLWGVPGCPQLQHRPRGTCRTTAAPSWLEGTDHPREPSSTRCSCPHPPPAGFCPLGWWQAAPEPGQSAEAGSPCAAAVHRYSQVFVTSAPTSQPSKSRRSCSDGLILVPHLCFTIKQR